MNTKECNKNFVFLYMGFLIQQIHTKKKYSKAESEVKIPIFQIGHE